MPELLRFDDQNQQRSSDFIIFTVASNFSLFFSVSSSIDRCSFASEVHDHDSFISQLTQPGILKVFEADRLSSFFDSYRLGIRMINGLEGLLLSSLDAKLAPKHLFRLCLEHEQKLNSSYKSAHAYNFYKDSNAPVMVKMVELVTILQQRIVFLLNECDGGAIPLSTPLAKFVWIYSVHLKVTGTTHIVEINLVLDETLLESPQIWEDIIIRLTRVVKAPEIEIGGCVVCRVSFMVLNSPEVWVGAGQAQTATKCFLSLEGDHLTLINVYWAFDEFLEKSKIGINKEKDEKSLRMVQGKFHQ